MNSIQDLWYSLISKMSKGVGAFITQSYTEVNVKRGKQFEASALFTIPAGQSVDLVYVSGSKPVSLKGKEIFFTGEKVTVEVYENPQYTGGTAQPVYNLTRINPSVSESTLLAGATVTDVGTKTQADRVFLGSTTQGSKSSASDMAEGLEHIFAPNTAYLERIKNDNGTDCEVSLYLTWYEGELDF